MRVCNRRDSCIIEKMGNCVFDSSNESMKYQKENIPSWLLLLALPMLILQPLPGTVTALCNEALDGFSF